MDGSQHLVVITIQGIDEPTLPPPPKGENTPEDNSDNPQPSGEPTEQPIDDVIIDNNIDDSPEEQTPSDSPTDSAESTQTKELVNTEEPAQEETPEVRTTSEDVLIKPPTKSSTNSVEYHEAPGNQRQESLRSQHGDRSPQEVKEKTISRANVDQVFKFLKQEHEPPQPIKINLTAEEWLQVERHAFEKQAMRDNLDMLHREMEESFEESQKKDKVAVYFTSGLSASFAAGAMSYLLRAGSLMSSFLATVPIWKGFDPIAILTLPKDKKDKKKTKTAQPADSTLETEKKAEDMFENRTDQ